MGCLKQLVIFDRMLIEKRTLHGRSPVPLDQHFTSLSFEQWKSPGCLGYIWDEILPSYLRIVKNHYKHLYKPTSTWKEDFFRGSHVVHPFSCARLDHPTACLSMLVVHLRKRCRTE